MQYTKILFFVFALLGGCVLNTSTATMPLHTESSPQKITSIADKKNPSLIEKSSHKKTQKCKSRLILKRLRKMCPKSSSIEDFLVTPIAWLTINQEHFFNKATDCNHLNLALPDSLTIARHKNLCVVSPRI